MPRQLRNCRQSVNLGKGGYVVLQRGSLHRSSVRIDGIGCEGSRKMRSNALTIGALTQLAVAEDLHVHQLPLSTLADPHQRDPRDEVRTPAADVALLGEPCGHDRRLADKLKRHIFEGTA